MSRLIGLGNEPIFRKSVLDNGVRVLTERHRDTISVSAGIFVDAGTRDEPSYLGGAAHFIEHLVFKGTKTKTGYQLARTLEAVGGELNAFTTRELTCFHATTLNEDMPIALDVLSDLVSHASFNKTDFQTERQVVLHEISMAMDNLEEFVFDLFFEHAYPGHPLSRSILGTPQTLGRMTRSELYDFYRRRYHGKNLVVAVTGNVEHDQVVEQINRLLGKSRRSHTRRPPRKAPKYDSFRRVWPRPSEQVHLLIGWPSTPYKDRLRFEAYIVNALLGGGMTSRLYRKIREDRGLAYSVYSYLHSFTDAGLLMVYAGCSRKNDRKVADIILREIKTLRKKGINQSDLNLFKTQVRGAILLGSEDIENRMNSIGTNELVFGEYRPVERVIEEVEKVSLDSVNEYLEKYLNPDETAVLVVGDVETNKTLKWLDSF